MNSLTSYRARRRRGRTSGFTLVEIMIVVVIIGFLAAMALPAFAKVRRNAQNGAFVNDLRQVRMAAEQYIMEYGAYPADGIAAIAPGLQPYLCSNFGANGTPVGGNWDWDYEQFGFKAGISVYMPRADAAQMTEIDRMIDDGDLGEGNFRSRSNGYIYVIEF